MQDRCKKNGACIDGDLQINLDSQLRRLRRGRKITGNIREINYNPLPSLSDNEFTVIDFNIRYKEDDRLLQGRQNYSGEAYRRWEKGGDVDLDPES